MTDIQTITDNLARITADIGLAAVKAGRHRADVTLIAVTKTFGADTVRQALSAGITDIGENYVQEARQKIEEIGKEAVRWHFIGGLQTNKAKYVVRLFDLVHSVDSRELAVEIDRRAGLEGRTMDILIQVDISREAQKSGVMEEDLEGLIAEIAPLSHIRLRGLMGMPPFGRDPEESRPYFQKLRGLLDRVNAAHIPGVTLSELSMGMSNDYIVAVEEGATMVRVGTALFGGRS